MSGLVEVLAAHEPGEDWHCRCGADMFGGSAAYSLQLLRAHIADQIVAHLRAVAANEGVRERVGRAVAKVDGFDNAPPGYDLLADAALAAFLGALAGEWALPGVVGPDDEGESL